MRVFFAGDVVGRPGRNAVEVLYPAIRSEYNVDVFIANCENAAGGSGITPEIAEELHSVGVDVMTSGDHIWKEKRILQYIDGDPYLLKPANLPTGTPGREHTVFTLKDGRKIGVVCLLGRTFMAPVECPFRTADRVLEEIARETPVSLVDMHAEATSEKNAIGRYLDGRASAVVGTHTHVQTADETIFSNGTAYITDAGMTGPFDSVIGREVKPVIHRFVTQMPAFFRVASGDVRITGVVIDIDDATGKANSIERVQHRL